MPEDDFIDEQKTKDELQYMILQCNRYLFQARIFKEHKNDEKPAIRGDPIDYLNKIFRSAHKQTKKTFHRVEHLTQGETSDISVLDISGKIIQINLKDEDISNLRDIVKAIATDEWDRVTPESIQESQLALNNLLDSINV